MSDGKTVGPISVQSEKNMYVHVIWLFPAYLNCSYWLFFFPWVPASWFLIYLENETSIMKTKNNFLKGLVTGDSLQRCVSSDVCLSLKNFL